MRSSRIVSKTTRNCEVLNKQKRFQFTSKKGLNKSSKKFSNHSSKKAFVKTANVILNTPYLKKDSDTHTKGSLYKQIIKEKNKRKKKNSQQ